MFKPLRARARPFLLSSLLLGALASTGCAHSSPATGLIQVQTPALLRQACPRPPRPDSPTIGDLATFSIEQEAAIGVCDARRSALAQIVEVQSRAQAALTRALAPRAWWKVW